MTSSECQSDSGLEFDIRNLELGGADYQYTLDFNNVPVGSDLWVWRKAVDFSSSTVEALATPIGIPVSITYQVGGNSIVFTAIPNINYPIPNTSYLTPDTKYYLLFCCNGDDHRKVLATRLIPPRGVV